MVIQRWQSVMLFLALAFMGIVMSLPFGYVFDPVSPDSVSPLMPLDRPVLFVVEALTALLLLIDIFLYKNLKLQTNVLLICMLLIVASDASVVIMTMGVNQILAIGSSLVLIAAFVLCIMARLFIRSDKRKLSESNRLR